MTTARRPTEKPVHAVEEEAAGRVCIRMGAVADLAVDRKGSPGMIGLRRRVRRRWLSSILRVGRKHDGFEARLARARWVIAQHRLN
jgi:hypothetical protein